MTGPAGEAPPDDCGPDDAAEPLGSLRCAPADDIAAVAAACKARILEREGIPMFLGLYDAREGRTLEVSDEPARNEGARLAELFDHYTAGLAAVPDEEFTELVVEGDTSDADPADLDPTGAAALIDVLVVLSDQHLRARTQGAS